MAPSSAPTRWPSNGRPAIPLRLLLSQMGLAALLLGLLGWLRWPRQPRAWTLLALVFAANLVFAIGYKTADVDVFYIRPW
jgi:uncharacterized membrane protein YedE/YeeE